MALPTVPRGEFRKKLTALEKARLYVGITLRPVRAAGAAIDMDTLPVLQPGDKTTGPGLARRAEPRRFDGKQVERVETVPVAVEAAQHLHEMVEIAAIPVSAAQRSARRQESGRDVLGGNSHACAASALAARTLSMTPTREPGVVENAIGDGGIAATEGNDHSISRFYASRRLGR